MNTHEWADEIKRLYFEGYTLYAARLKVRRMMKEEARRKLLWR